MVNLLFNFGIILVQNKKIIFILWNISIIYIALETLSISILLPFFSVILGQKIRHFSFIEVKILCFQDLLLFLVITVAFTLQSKFLLIFFFFY